jgi:hypothetical protein
MRACCLLSTASMWQMEEPCERARDFWRYGPRPLTANHTLAAGLQSIVGKQPWRVMCDVCVVWCLYGVLCCVCCVVCVVLCGCVVWMCCYVVSVCASQLATVHTCTHSGALREYTTEKRVHETGERTSNRHKVVGVRISGEVVVVGVFL